MVGAAQRQDLAGCQPGWCMQFCSTLNACLIHRHRRNKTRNTPILENRNIISELAGRYECECCRGSGTTHVKGATMRRLCAATAVASRSCFAVAPCVCYHCRDSHFFCASSSSRKQKGCSLMCQRLHTADLPSFRKIANLYSFSRQSQYYPV
jgi:hypothetical protein